MSDYIVVDEKLIDKLDELKIDNGKCIPSLVSWYKRMRGERRPCGFCAGSRDRIRLHQLSIDFSR